MPELFARRALDLAGAHEAADHVAPGASSVLLPGAGADAAAARVTRQRRPRPRTRSGIAPAGTSTPEAWITHALS